MGNTNSTSSKDVESHAGGNASATDPNLTIKRHHSINTHNNPSSHHAAATIAGRTTSAAMDRSSARIGRTSSIFGRASSHDGASSPGPNRSRSGSLSSFLVNQRRGSATTATASGNDTPTLPEGQVVNGTTTLPPPSFKVQQQPLDMAGYEISSAAGPSSSLETTIRSNAGRTRRVTEGLGIPSAPGGFDPRNFVSPHPSPSVATQAHYAAGFPSHHAAVNVSSGLRVSSSGAPSTDVHPTTMHRGSEPQMVPGTSARASTRHPLFGVGGNSIFPNVGTSLGTTGAASPPAGTSSPVLSSQPLNLGEDGQDFGSPSHRTPAALPSYLKIPTAIPSAHAFASSPPTSVYSHHSDRALEEGQRPASPSIQLGGNGRPTQVVGGAGAAAAVLDTVDVVIPPGDASKVSSPTQERKVSLSASSDNGNYSDLNVDAARAAGIDVTDLPSQSPIEKPSKTQEAAPVPEVSVEEEVEGGERASRSMERTSDNADLLDGAAPGPGTSATSRTPTPTPGTYGSRAMTPTMRGPTGLRSLSPAAGPTTSEGPPSQPISARRSHVDVQTGGGESGFNTPLLPPGLTSAPPSASTPGMTPLSEVSVTTPTSASARDQDPMSSQPQTPSKASSVTSTTQPSTPSSLNPPSQLPTHYQQQPLMPIVLTWRAGGKEVFVTGTFANEWRSKILLHRSKRDHTCVLHLPPGTHRLKFIVDDRWRVSRDLPTATDGDGNLVNYVEIPNVGPAHPGPLSAPGEDLPESRAEKARSERGSKIDSKRTTMNLVEEARRAEAMRLDDFFDDDGKDQEETWTNEIPPSLIEAQEAEESYRESTEGEGNQDHHHRHGQDSQQQRLPHPPALPRQLEKVILNSSPANNNGGNLSSTVDDNSILPAPNHVVLNHLTASSIKGGVLAVGTTTRYKRKYVTTVYYRPVQV